MRKILILCLLSISFSGVLAQQVIENPEKPLSQNAGRTVRLQEVLRIKDEGKGFYFKEPWGLNVAPDGSIFVQDGRALYKFTSGGRFDGNLIKIGQGPGEISSDISSDFLVNDTEVLLLSAPIKLLKIDLAGKLLKEWIFGKSPFFRLIAFYDQKYYVLNQHRNFERTTGLKDVDLDLFLLNEDGTSHQTPCSLKTQVYLEATARGSHWNDITKLNISKESGGFLYIANTQEYQIKQLDLKKAEISRIFSRSYPRVKYQKKNPRDRREMPAFDNDVYRLLVYKDQVWVLTSTYDPNKGILVDVFDAYGKYLDNFWLSLLNIRTGDTFYQRYFPVIIQGDYLYAIEHDADWAYSIAKYQI